MLLTGSMGVRRFIFIECLLGRWYDATLTRTCKNSHLLAEGGVRQEHPAVPLRDPRDPAFCASPIYVEAKTAFVICGGFVDIAYRYFRHRTRECISHPCSRFEVEILLLHQHLEDVVVRSILKPDSGP